MGGVDASGQDATAKVVKNMYNNRSFAPMEVATRGRLSSQRTCCGSPFLAVAVLLLVVFGGTILASGETNSVKARPIRIRTRRAEASLPLSQIEFVPMSLGSVFNKATAQECLYLLAMAAVVAMAIFYRTCNARLLKRERELTTAIERSTTEATAAHQSNRAKDRFLATLSHELRTPLTPVLLSVGALLEQKDIATGIREDLEMIRRNIELEAQLLDDLFDISQIERGLMHLKLESVDIHEVIRRARDICFAPIFEAGLNVLEEFAAGEYHVHGDSARLMQLFWNLFRNAARFAPPGTTLTIRSYNRETGTAPAASGRGPLHDDSAGSSLGARLLVVEFEDTGIGIAPEWLDRIFDPFEQGGETLPRRGSGLGLGLAIGLEVAQAHGGRLSASSPGPGQGATFRVELLTAPAPEWSSQRIEPAKNPPRPLIASLRILLIEDNADTLRYLERTLRRHGCEVHPASSIAAGRQALAQADFDLLISDIELPDGSGLQLMRELHAQGVPGIALSGHSSEDDQHQSHSVGFFAHLVKPVIADVLYEAVCRASASRITDKSSAAMPGPAPGSTPHTGPALPARSSLHTP